MKTEEVHGQSQPACADTEDLMQSYKGYLIDGMPVSVHPFSPDWFVGGTVLKRGRFTTVVEFIRFQFLEFKVDIKELALWFGLELARMIVDELLCAENYGSNH